MNPQAVNQPNLDVFTRNKRSVLLLEHEVSKQPVAVVAIGALLVGSIVWTHDVRCGCCQEFCTMIDTIFQKQVKRGDEIGYFAYGGSTLVAVFPPGVIKFDDDLVKNSIGEGPAAAGKEAIETLMKVGYSLGKIPDA